MIAFPTPASALVMPTSPFIPNVIGAGTNWADWIRSGRLVNKLGSNVSFYGRVSDIRRGLSEDERNEFNERALTAALAEFTKSTVRCFWTKHEYGQLMHIGAAPLESR